MGAVPPDARRAFATTVGLITTGGPGGPNVMAAEWTYHVSYNPFLILVLVRSTHATHRAILEETEFGVSLCSEAMVRQANFAGSYSKHSMDKLSSELFELYPAQRIRAPLVRGAILNAECRLVATHEIGDHTAFVGEVVAATWDPEKRPLVLHRGYRGLGERIAKAESVSVTATPMTARAGTEVLVAGELTSAEGEDGRDVAIEIRGPEGDAVATLAATTDGDGYYAAPWTAPRGLAAGPYTAVATAGRAVGRGRLVIA